MASTRPAALLVHGLGGTVYDLGSLGKTLEDAGFVTHTPLLPGHGGMPEDLLGARWQDWVEAIAQSYRALKAKHGTVHLAGVCLGGLVALEVARQEQHSGRLALYAPPMFLDGWSLPRLTWARHIVYRIPGLAERMRVPEAEPFGIKNVRLRKIIQQRFERGERFHYPYVPLACIREVDRLRHHLKARLADIHCSTLIVHAAEDDITSPRSARYLQQHLGGPVEYMPLNNSYHMVMVDNERNQVLERSQRFFSRPALNTSPASNPHWGALAPA
ncbi:MAG TPA: alpha/beta fold hydrolase [Chromobacteriaceae bacterium]|nr:alpha/beta fold hydrolase [Chromobacteriaceae bacterium]